MDFENFDEALYNPRQTTLNRFLIGFGVLLVATFLLPIDRGPVNIWDRFGVDGGLTVLRLLLPAAVGAAFLYLGVFAKLDVKVKSTVTAGLLATMVVVGVNPFEVLRIVVAPVDPLLTTGLGMVDGAYFPREDLTHLILLGAALVTLGVGGGYRAQRQSSRIGAWITMGGGALLAAYYLVPYDGQIPFARNLTLHGDFNAVAAEIGNEDPAHAGALQLAAAYFAVVYFAPFLLGIVSIGAWFKTRYLGDRILFAKLSGWGAPLYLLGLLLPMLFKEGGRVDGAGFLPNLRSYIILATIMVGLTLAVAMALVAHLEPEATDTELPESPMEWRRRQKK